MTPAETEAIRTSLSNIAPEGWAYMGVSGPFANEIRGADTFSLICTFAGEDTDYDPGEIGRAVADMPRQIGALLAELDRAHPAARRWEALRATAAGVQAATGLAIPDDDALAEMLAAALQNTARADYAERALRTDAAAHVEAAAHLRKLLEGQQARAERAEEEVDRLRAMVPRLEWREGTGFVSARAGVFVAIVSGKGWELRVYLPYCTGAGDLVDRGPETGPAGKAAAEAAYRRACGLPAIPACAG